MGEQRADLPAVLGTEPPDADGSPARLNGGMFTSATDEWGTPSDFFDMLDAEFGFTLDVCARAENAKVKRFYSRDDDGLRQAWHGVCWMNPPYGRAIGDWVKKAYIEAAYGGATVVCLIPARTDTAYWHDYVMKAAEIRLVRGRLHFEGDKSKGHNAPFPCAVVVFRPGLVTAFGGNPEVRAIGRSATEEAA